MTTSTVKLSRIRLLACAIIALGASILSASDANAGRLVKHTVVQVDVQTHGQFIADVRIFRKGKLLFSKDNHRGGRLEPRLKGKKFKIKVVVKYLGGKVHSKHRRKYKAVPQNQNSNRVHSIFGYVNQTNVGFIL